MPHSLYKNIQLKEDGSYIVDKEGLPYHVPNGYGYEAEHAIISAWLLTNPDDVTPYVEPVIPEPTDEQIAAQVRAERDAKIKSTEARINRYRNQKEAKIATTDSATWYKNALLYLEELRNITEQPGFPRNVVWPEEPK